MHDDDLAQRVCLHSARVTRPRAWQDEPVRRFCVLFFCAGLVLGCQAPIVDHVPLTISLPDAPDCRAAVGAITLTALGDFPTTDRDVAQLDSTGAPLGSLTRFPSSTLAFSASARSTSWEAFGWATRPSPSADVTIVMRPIGLSCPIADPEARLPRGAAVVALGQDEVMFVGGLDDTGEARSRFAILHVPDETVDLPAIQGPIAFAAATLVPEGDAVFVSGGAFTEDGDANDNWTRVSRDGSDATFGRLHDRRRDHAAIAVDAGAVHGVLLVGGNDGRDAVSTIEWVDPARRTGALLHSLLVSPRVSPLLVALDDHEIAIVGGTSGAEVLTSIEVLDVASDSIRTLNITLGVPDWVAVLPSGRLAWASGGMLSIVSLREERVDASVRLPAITSPVAVALPSGRVLLEGSTSALARIAYVIDPGAGTVVQVATSRLPLSVLTLADGTTLELARSGASVRRDERGSPFDSPPPTYLFATDRATLALDASSRWSVTGAMLTPTIDGARLDIPVLRLLRFGALIDAMGRYDVVLTGEHMETLATVNVTDESIAVGRCALTRMTGRRAMIQRSADGRVVVGDENLGSVRCDAGIPSGARVGIGLVAHTGAMLRSLALTRDL